MRPSVRSLQLLLVAVIGLAASLPLLFPSGDAPTGSYESASASFEAFLETLDADDAVLLVRLDARLSPEERARAEDELFAHPMTRSRSTVDPLLWRVSIPMSEALAKLNRLDEDPRVHIAEPEISWSLLDVPTAGFDGAPDDPLFPFQWNFEQIGMSEAWRRSTGKGVVVAVIDTGVAGRDVPEYGWRGVRDLAETRMVGGWDFVGHRALAHDLHGHGTHVAGTIAQSTNNGYGVAGIAPDAAIMPLRVLDEQGRGSTGGIADAIRFAADNGAHIINMSLGGPLPSRVLDEAIQYAHRKGVTVIAAAGNSSTSLPSYPAAYRNVIAVSATQYDRTTTFYSNYGRYISIAAPGGNTRVDQSGDGRPDGIMQETIVVGDPNQHEFALYMGTSMASPHVAGVAALLHAQGITRPDRIRSILTGTATREVPSFSRERYGAGLLDADAATRAALTKAHGPRAPLAWLIALFGLMLAHRQRGLRAQTPWLTIATTTVVASGLSLLLLPADWLGLTLPPGAWHTSMVLWPSMLVGSINGWSHALWLSAAPALLVYGLFGALPSRWIRSILIGLLLGWGAYLCAEAILPLHDVRWIPGTGILDRAWLAGHGVLLVASGIVASRRH